MRSLLMVASLSLLTACATTTKSAAPMGSALPVSSAAESDVTGRWLGTWIGTGLFTRLWGMVLLPPALAQSFVVLRDGRGYFWAVLLLAATMLSLLALTYAELGATYPVAGGSGRFPYYSHGPIVGFSAGWASWLQAVFVAAISDSTSRPDCFHKGAGNFAPGN